MTRLDWTYMGRQAYRTALRLQYRHASRVAAGAAPLLIFLEHPPTITLGRHADASHLKLSKEELAARGIEVHRVKRGGDVTYHGPGQLVGYPVACLESTSVPRWVEGHAQAIVRFLQGHQIPAEWSPENPGVWVGSDKIAALGFHISRRVSTHGFAVNIDPDLSHFNTIVPCGLQGCGVTSMRALGVRVPTIQEAARQLAGLVAESFGWSLGTAQQADQVVNELEASTHLRAAG
jgi:lipoyl(octanoyl) transferase